MVFDGIVAHAVTESLQALVGGRILKIYQPHSTELIFNIRAKGKNQKLLISTNAQFSRYHITDISYENPKEPTMFCMLLRKHLEGNVIESINQVQMERIIHMDFKGRNELGDLTSKRLIIELMGRHSNVILTDLESGKILDSIKHLSPAINSYRTVLPGHTYTMPPHQDKLNPAEATSTELISRIDFNSGKLAQQIVENVGGFSMDLAKELLHRAGLPKQKAIENAFLSLQEDINRENYHFSMTVMENGKENFHVIPMEQWLESGTVFDNVHQLLDRFYETKAESDLVKQKANDLSRLVSTERKKNLQKIKKLNKTLKETENAAQYQLNGELLTAHLHTVKKGEKEATVTNYYDENQALITIPIDPLKSPSENAQSYFKKYNKAKTAVIVVEEQLRKTNEEIDYLERILQQIESASLRDIEEIREELQEQGYVRKKKAKKEKKKNKKPDLETFYSSSGSVILVGKNNKQNDYLTMKAASPQDLWFHTKDIPGSHVVIRSQQASADEIEEAASLAAYFSKSRLSSSVPVDYTLVKHVKKPSGAKPGFVIYDHQNTVFVTPSEERVRQLKTNTAADKA